jgi:hypothetical protein
MARHHARTREGEIISHDQLTAIAERLRATLRGLELADVEVLITAVARLQARAQSVGARLDDFGDVIDLPELARLIGRKPSYLQKWQTIQNNTGILCLPEEIPGAKHRYTKDAVRRWLKTGASHHARHLTE